MLLEMFLVKHKTIGSTKNKIPLVVCLLILDGILDGEVQDVRTRCILKKHLGNISKITVNLYDT